MSIQHAILGLLSFQPMTGYDVKKVIAESVALYWSGNNNQIYTTLVRLHRQGLLSLEVRQQESAPPRKIYSITESGRAELKTWLLSEPELPQLKHPFIIQLSWADQLTPAELDSQLERYQQALEMRLLLYHGQKKKPKCSAARSKREAYLWSMILDNAMGFYENELSWLRRLRRELALHPQGEGKTP